MSRLMLGVRWGSWIEQPAWLPAGAAPADCLKDFRLEGSELSVYLLPDDADPARVATALAGTRQRFDTYGYIIFDLALVTALRIEVSTTKGTTPDPVVDEWHRDLTELTVANVTALVHHLWANRNAGLGKVAKPIVRDRLVDGVKRGQLNIELMDVDMQKAIRTRIAAVK